MANNNIFSKLKDAYKFLFYKLYRYYEDSEFSWWSDWKAALTIDLLGLFICLSAIVYYSVFTKQGINFGDGKIFILILGILILTPNYFIFHHKDQWKKIVEEFDKLPKRTNRIGGWLVFIFVLLIIANLIFSFYLMSQIDWKLYR